MNGRGGLYIGTSRDMVRHTIRSDPDTTVYRTYVTDGWWMVDGGWWIVDGGWRMEDGGWWMMDSGMWMEDEG